MTFGWKDGASDTPTYNLRTVTYVSLSFIIVCTSALRLTVARVTAKFHMKISVLENLVNLERYAVGSDLRKSIRYNTEDYDMKLYM